jgi:cytochrome c-type biogenesis protein
VYYVVAVVCLLIGVQILAGLNAEIPGVAGCASASSCAHSRRIASGTGLRVVASQCATPVLAAILTYVMAQQGAVSMARRCCLCMPWARRAHRVGRDVHRCPATFGCAGALDALLEKISGVIVLGVGCIFCG